MKSATSFMPLLSSPRSLPAASAGRRATAAGLRRGNLRLSLGRERADGSWRGRRKHGRAVSRGRRPLRASTTPIRRKRLPARDARLAQAQGATRQPQNRQARRGDRRDRGRAQRGADIALVWPTTTTVASSSSARRASSRNPSSTTPRRSATPCRRRCKRANASSTSRRLPARPEEIDAAERNVAALEATLAQAGSRSIGGR